jgi:hypothetical protein
LTNRRATNARLFLREAARNQLHWQELKGFSRAKAGLQAQSARDYGQAHRKARAVAIH